MTFTKIMVPVDLQHAGQLDKAISVALDMARAAGAKLVFVAVTGETPGAIAHHPAEFQQKLEEFARMRAGDLADRTEAKSYAVGDPTAQIDKVLRQATHDTGADLVVMASHIPNVMDAIWPSHAGSLAAHADISVLVVR